MASLDQTTFEYLMPTDKQKEVMQQARSAFRTCAEVMDTLLPIGADKDYVIRLIRDAGMWANVAITRDDYGAPRK